MKFYTLFVIGALLGATDAMRITGDDAPDKEAQKKTDKAIERSKEIKEEKRTGGAEVTDEPVDKEAKEASDKGVDQQELEKKGWAYKVSVEGKKLIKQCEEDTQAANAKALANRGAHTTHQHFCCGDKEPDGPKEKVKDVEEQPVHESLQPKDKD